MGVFQRFTKFAALAAAVVADAAPEKAAEPESGEEEKAVLTMTKENFDDVIGQAPFVLVKFYAPWCGHCKDMAPGYEKAAQELASEDSPVVLGEVDATVEVELAQKYDVNGYPTLLWFTHGEKREYNGPRTTAGILDWIKTHTGPVVKVSSEEDMQKLLAERKWSGAVLVARGSPAVLPVAEQVAKNGAEWLMAAVVHVASEEKQGFSLYKGTAEEAHYEGDLTSAEAVTEWAKKARVPLFGQINEDNFELYVESAKNGLFWVCLDPSKLEEELPKYSPAFVEAAGKSTESYPFVWLDVAEFESHAREELGCTSYPTVVLQRGDLLGDSEDGKVEKFVRSFSEKPEDMTAEAIATFLADVKSGKIEPAAEPDELDTLDEDDEDAQENVPAMDDEDL